MQEPLCEKGFLQHYTPTPTQSALGWEVVFFCNRGFGFSGTFLGINYGMLPNCEWNQKQKHKKQP